MIWHSPLLELIGSAAARELLQRVAQRTPETRQGQEARAALERLAGR